MNYSVEVAKKLLEINAVVIKDQDHLFTWASGIKSPIYCDNRLTMAYPDIREMIAEGFIELMKDLGDIDVIVGTATAGIPHAAFIAHKLAKPMAYVRSSAKGHGRQNQIEGLVRSGDRVVVIEDLFSTGGSSVKAVKALQELGVNVVKVLAIFSYNFQKVTDVFEEAKVPFATITDYKTLLPIAVETGYLPQEKQALLEKWSQTPHMFTEK